MHFSPAEGEKEAVDREHADNEGSLVIWGFSMRGREECILGFGL
jgi:hypothetical protein